MRTYAGHINTCNTAPRQLLRHLYQEQVKGEKKVKMGSS